MHRDTPGVGETLAEAAIRNFTGGSQTVLLWAAECGHLQVVRILLTTGADPESAGERIHVQANDGKTGSRGQAERCLEATDRRVAECCAGKAVCFPGLCTKRECGFGHAIPAEGA